VPIGDDTSSSTGESGGEEYPSWDIIGRLPLLLHSSMNAPQERNTANRTCPGLMTSIVQNEKSMVVVFGCARADGIWRIESAKNVQNV
tara:strand:- start:810 stop:1073 length:264 start_codon:yes stop_codon:yes gene_type:complete